MSRYLNEVGVSSSSSHNSSTAINVTEGRKCEIRTEYYNDFDVCLKEYYSRSHSNLSRRCDDDEVTRTKKSENSKRRSDRKLLGKQDYKRRSSWNEVSKRETDKPEYYKVYTFSDEKDTVASSSYSKAKEDCDENVTPTNEPVENITFSNDDDGIDTTIVTFDNIVEIFPR